jgi:N-dimethylarginine dimethylaminohydrolase
MGAHFERLCREMGGRKLAEVDPAFDLSLERQTNALAELLTGRGVTVHRGRPLEPVEAGPSPDGQPEGFGTLFVRDPTLVIGSNIIEVNLRMRIRRGERHSVRGAVQQVVSGSDATWVGMPAAWPGPDELDDVSAFLEGGDTLLNGPEIYRSSTSGGSR